MFARIPDMQSSFIASAHFRQVPTHWAGLTFRSVELEHANPDEILAAKAAENSADAGMLREVFQ